MRKLVLASLGGGYNLSLFNSNNALIEAELQDKVLYRDNTSGEANQMENDLDMNSNYILNVAFEANPTDNSIVNKKYVDDQDAATLATAIQTIGASLNTFATGVQLQCTGSSGATSNTMYDLNVIFGLSSTVNSVQAFINGVYQYDASFTVAGRVVTFSESLEDADSILFIIGEASGGVSEVLEQNATFTATAGQTVFDLTAIFPAGTYYDLSVYINGVHQEVNVAYTRSTNLITFTEGLSLGDSVSVITRIQ